MYNYIMANNNKSNNEATTGEGVAVILENQVAGEKNQARRHSENCDQHGTTRRILYGVAGSLIAVIAMGVVYHYFAMYKAVKKNVSLRQENAVQRERNAAKLEDKEDDIKAAEEKIQRLEAKVNFQSGRMNDMKLSEANQLAYIEELKLKTYDEKYLPFSAQQIMYFEAYHTVAENVRPLKLSRWIGHATPKDWIGYLRMAVARNSFNVYEAIMEHKEVTSIPEVASFIEATEVLAKLKR